MYCFVSITALCLLAFVGMSQAAPSQKSVSPREALEIAHQVKSIFEAKCLDCHGAELPRPKGKFGYVLNLQRVAGNPNFIKRGDPERSELYHMLVENEMPGDDANVAPLTEAEKAIVKRWIEIGAPHTLPEPAIQAPIAAATPVVPKIDAGEPALPTWKRAIRWVGRFHPVSTHFPVALMYVAVLAEALAWWTRRPSWMQTVRFLVVLGAMGAVVTAGLGWVNASFSSYVGSSISILNWHRWLGTVTTVWAVACAVLVVISENHEGSPERQRFRGALLVGALLVGVSGFLGSALIYGLNHYAW